jgi:Raf kinase inhibitor-like YbhB/YbcL family protein
MKRHNLRLVHSVMKLVPFVVFLASTFVLLVFLPIEPSDMSKVTSSFILPPFAETTPSLSSSQKLKFTLSSPAFAHGQAIPTAFERATSFNQMTSAWSVDYSPPLSWTNIPDGTQSFVLLVDDPEHSIRRAPKMQPWVHWVVYNIPATTTALGVGNSLPSYDLPPGAVQGLNDWNQVGFTGPSPPSSEKQPHRYYFKLYALDVVLDTNLLLRLQQHYYSSNTAAVAGRPKSLPRSPAASTVKAAVVLAAMQGHVLGKAELIGTYKRNGGIHREEWLLRN